MMARRDRRLLLARREVDAAFQPNARVREVELWDAWQLAAVESAVALESWMSAQHDEKELGYNAFVACLDREEQAARALTEYVDPAAARRLRARR